MTEKELDKILSEHEAGIVVLVDKKDARHGVDLKTGDSAEISLKKCGENGNERD